jgi:hypothetical protein
MGSADPSAAGPPWIRVIRDWLRIAHAATSEIGSPAFQGQFGRAGHR